MTPEELAAFHRFIAARLRVEAARQEMAAAAVTAAASIRGLGHAVQEGERREIAEHPDLAELDAQLEGFYG